MRLYETLFILRPDLSDEESRSWIQRIVQVIEQNKGEIVRLDEWGVVKLAYTIRKFQKGNYIYAVFMADYQCLRELERHFKMLEPVLRHIIVKLDDRELEKHKQAQMAREAAAKGESKPEETQEAQVSEGEMEVQSTEEVPV